MGLNTGDLVVYQPKVADASELVGQIGLIIGMPDPTDLPYFRDCYWVKFSHQITAVHPDHLVTLEVFDESRRYSSNQ